MSVRITALYIVVAGLSIYAWKDWFKSLCGLILMMAVLQHADAPKSMFGIQGFNPWNILFIVIFLAWLFNRRRECIKWDMPRHINVLLLMYLGVIVVGVLRAVFDRSYIQDYPLKSLISEELINTIKWIVPGLLLFDGCRTRKRVVMALACILVMYFLIAIQVVHHIPIEAAFDYNARGVHDAQTKIQSRVGYGRNDLSPMLAGVSWAILAALPLVRRKKYWVVLLAAAGVVVFAQALTGGRAGYVAWGATGLTLCLVKWRKYLIIAPVVLILLPIVFPGAVKRMLTGLGRTNVAGETTVDTDSMTSGRLEFWPYVVDGIIKSPLVGYGRLAMKRSGIYDQIETEMPGTGAPHPHNMYLQTLLDNGILGSIPIFLLWATMVVYPTRVFRSDNRLFSAVGGMALAFVLARLVGGIGGERLLYPREIEVGLWAAFFLALRIYVEDRRVRTNMVDTENSWDGLAFRRRQAAITPGYG